MRILPNSVKRGLHVLLLLGAAIFLCLHAVHLTADFPNNSPWMDWSKYTDEGWYGDGAIRHYQLGHWYVAGDFNPAAALPVWPLLEALVFRFSGVSLVAARGLTVAVFGLTLVACWVLLNRWRPRESYGAAFSLGAPSLAASTAVLLLAASPFCFVFTRLAILEPLLVLWTVLAMLAAGTARADESARAWSWPDARPTLRRNLGTILALGVLLPVIVLTKTTGLFLLPAIAWLLFAAVGYRKSTFLVVSLPAMLLSGLLWVAYFTLAVRPHFLLDYRYLFSANAYTGITLATSFQVLWDTVKDGMWMGPRIYPLALVAVAWSLVRFRRLREFPLAIALVLWAGGYAAFLAYHANLQPRYYLVVAVPLMLLVPVVAEQVVLAGIRRPALARIGFAVAAVAVLVVVVPDAVQTISYVRRPEYTLLEAARQVKATIDDQERADPAHNPLVLSISGSELSLMTGLHSIDDDFGTLELPARVKLYRPGWYVAWNEIDDDKMDAMTPLFHVERVAAFPAMDDPDRNLLIVYRLDPADPTPPLKRKGKPTPRSLVTRVGQQPSTTQLKH